MHLVVRYGFFHNAVKYSPRSLLYHGRARYFSISAPSKQTSSFQETNISGNYTPRAQPNTQAKDIAVLGGGITGLATAFNLTNDVPGAKITIYESQENLGGWIASEIVEVDDGEVLFEWGPRTLRPDLNGAGRATLQLIPQLGDLSKHIRGILHSSPAATNRYLYYPDHLVRMPGRDPSQGLLSAIFKNIYTVATEPIFSGVISGIMAEPTVRVRPTNMVDESVGDFLRRRFGKSIADNLVSALFHGIYAGDIYKLSARTLLPALWYLEGRDADDGNGIFAEMAELTFRNCSLRSYDLFRFQNRYVHRLDQIASLAFFTEQMRATSVYSFARGIGQLTDSLEQELSNKGNVTMITGRPVNCLTWNSDKKQIDLGLQGMEGLASYDYVVSSLSSSALSKITGDGAEIKELTNELTKGPRGVNVMVVNLYYQNPNLLPVSGFGYLIPRSIALEQNPERALGVIFGSETAGPRGKDAIRKLEIVAPTDTEIDIAKRELESAEAKPGNGDHHITFLKDMIADLEARKTQGDRTEEIRIGQDSASGTKLTVMLGGHWWDDWTSSDLPSESEAIEMAKSVLARQLKIFEKPMLARARLQQECIPQYQVGYRGQMARIHEGLMKNFHGRLKVAGTWWQGGVGVNDCVKKARETSTSIREGWDDNTGLEDFCKPEKWLLYDRRSGTTYSDPLQKNV